MTVLTATAMVLKDCHVNICKCRSDLVEVTRLQEPICAAHLHARHGIIGWRRNYNGPTKTHLCREYWPDTVEIVTAIGTRFTVPTANVVELVEIVMSVGTRFTVLAAKMVEDVEIVMALSTIFTVATTKVVEDGRSALDLQERVSTTVIEDGLTCSTCTLQNSVFEAHCMACSPPHATNSLKRGRPSLSSSKACADGSSTASSVSDHGARARGHGGKVARFAQPAMKESHLAAGISGASQGVVVEAEVVLGQPICNDSLRDPNVTECGHPPSRNRELPSPDSPFVPTAHVAAYLLTSLMFVRQHVAPPACPARAAWGTVRKPIRKDQRRLCEHKRRPSKCAECGSSAICEHGQHRNRCVECGGNGFCEHGRVRSQCRGCGGSMFCKDSRRRAECKECGGSAICEHGRKRHYCRECGARGGICEHGVRECKECGGARICEHGRLHRKCREYGGSKVCEH